MQGGEEEPAASSHDTPSRAGQPFITIIKKKTNPNLLGATRQTPFAGTRHHLSWTNRIYGDTSKPSPTGAPSAARGDAAGPAPGATAAQMMPVGAKTGVTQSDSAISQPQDSGAQTLSRSSSLCGGLPWNSWMVFLQKGRHGGSSPL